MQNREVLFSENDQAKITKEITDLVYFSASIDRASEKSRVFRSYKDEALSFTQRPCEAVSPGSSVLLMDSRYSRRFFEDKGYKLVDPLQVINNNKHKTTDFVGAGIQAIEDQIHSPTKVEKSIIFVGQPSFRTQHVGGTHEGFSPAFVNLASVGTGLNFAEHCSIIKNWEDYLVSLGMKKTDIQYQENIVQKHWGNTKMIGHEIYYCYQGFPLGDSSYNVVTEGAHQGFAFSDTGFGLERIKWLLKGGEYAQTFSSLNKSYDLPYSEICRLHALTLLVGQNVTPGANGERAKTRKLSRDFVRNSPNIEDTAGMVGDFYENWTYWGEMLLDKPTVVDIIVKENLNNLNKK